MPRYKIGHFVVASDFVLDAPLTKSKKIATAHFLYRKAFLHKKESKTLTINNEVKIQFHSVNVIKNVIHHVTLAECSRKDAESFARKFIVPFFLQNSGETVIHGSGVIKGQKAMIFIGPSGAGKSTLAYLLSQMNFKFLADDFVWLQKQNSIARATPLVTESYLLKRNPVIRNRSSLKYNNSGHKFAIQMRPRRNLLPPQVTDIFYLQPKGKRRFSCEPVQGAQKAKLAFENIYGIGLTGFLPISDIFTRTLDVVEGVRFWKLTYPRDPNNLSKSLAELLNMIGGQKIEN